MVLLGKQTVVMRLYLSNETAEKKRFNPKKGRGGRQGLLRHCSSSVRWFDIPVGFLKNVILANVECDPALIDLDAVCSITHTSNRSSLME